MATATPPRTVSEFHRAGQLASHYPRVQEALAGLSDAELVSAGLLLSRVDPAEVLREHPTVPAVDVAVTGHGTLSQLVAPLTAELARHGLLPRLSVADFDSYVFDLGTPDSALYAAAPDVVLCVLDPMVVFDEVAVPWRPQDVERVAAEKLELVTGLAARYQASGKGTLVLNTLPLPRTFTAQLVDHRSRSRLSAIWHEANARLLRLADEYPAVVVLDLAPLIAEGVAATEPRMSVYAKAHLSPALLAGYAREVGHLCRHLTGRTKKTLAVDLDGTVWGGILGEDGLDDIEVADSPRGEAFRLFQRVLKQLSSQGVLLAAVSKNDREPVLAAFRDRPGMTLSEDDFVRITANWRPKDENLAELAEALNLGTDSFVFVDDSPYECGLVRFALPGVAVVEVGADPALHVADLLRDGWFDTRELTSEDRGRVAKYRDELVRADFMDSFDSLEAYLGQLGVTVQVALADEADIARVSQLTLRTNQFNLTAARFQPAEVRALLDDPARNVVVVRSADRFGENGLIGAVFLSRTADGLHLDNFLLSCRVFSRGVEQTVLAAILGRAKRSGAAQVTADCRETAKNHKVRDFYARNGFVLESVAGPHSTFRHDLGDILEIPGHIALTEALGGIAS